MKISIPVSSNLSDGVNVRTPRVSIKSFNIQTLLKRTSIFKALESSFFKLEKGFWEARDNSIFQILHLFTIGKNFDYIFNEKSLGFSQKLDHWKCKYEAVFKLKFCLRKT